MTYNEFVNKYLGTKTDYDGVSGVQCVDLIKLYIKKVFGVTPQSIGNAHSYYDDFNDTYLTKYFTRIKYKKGIKAQKGDIVVWGIKYNGSSKYGHIAIATGNQTSSSITTYDQNYGVKEMHKVVHKLTGVSGFLRPKNQKNIATPPSIANGSYKLTNARGVYKGYGASTGRKQVKDLTSDAKKHATAKSGDAYLKKGTKITVKETKLISSGNLWAKIPSGYICIWECDKNKKFVNK